MDAKNFFEIAKRESKLVTVIKADKEDVRQIASAANLDDRWALTKQIPDTRRFHQFRPSEVNDQLVCSVNSLYTQLAEATPVNKSLKLQQVPLPLVTTYLLNSRPRSLSEILLVRYVLI